MFFFVFFGFFYYLDELDVLKKCLRYSAPVFPPVRYKFKALELNRKILEGALAPKKPAPKEVTRPEGFQLEVEKRLHERNATKKPAEPEDHTFHSKPLPTRILEEVVVRSS